MMLYLVGLSVAFSFGFFAAALMAAGKDEEQPSPFVMDPNNKPFLRRIK
ncbi:hypothetical protein [Fictibacillus fluitans]|uniref:Uncharacterized protein n=1 Tax=Fictibacillus fluitans TaxID=3058422 RepID=A0ABT8HXB2_9BACL|nr:hypothetical protein [Fictibacillus sp. NE201]MDN4525349.1 hypothetical protein [Fictibacillus sp. NE201]